MRMRIGFVIAICLLGCTTSASAQNWGSVDTLKLAGLQPGLRMADVSVRIHCKLDTTFWGGSNGASILGFAMPFFGVDGEYKVATDPLGVTQVSFVAAPKDSIETASSYTKLVDKLQKRLGPPNEVYNNGFRFVTWRGAKQELSIKTKDGTHYLTAVLMKPERPQAPASPAATRGELQPTRKRK